jgi:hypothetical protein
VRKGRKRTHIFKIGRDLVALPLLLEGTDFGLVGAEFLRLALAGSVVASTFSFCRLIIVGVRVELVREGGGGGGGGNG